MFFCVMSLGDLYLERFIHGVAYFQNFTVFHVSKCTLAYLSRDQIYSHLYRQKFISIVIQALLYFVQCILSQRHQLISTIPSTVPLPQGHLYNVDTKVCPPGESTCCILIFKKIDKNTKLIESIKRKIPKYDLYIILRKKVHNSIN